MKQFINNPRDSESSSQYPNIRLAELNDQHWDRSKSENLAANEDIILSDEHWDVILYLRNYYHEYGLPRFARTTARALNSDSPLTVATSIYTSFLLAVLLHKAVALPTCAYPPMRLTFHLAPIIDMCLLEKQLYTFHRMSGARR